MDGINDLMGLVEEIEDLRTFVYDLNERGIDKKVRRHLWKILGKYQSTHKI